MEDEAKIYGSNEVGETQVADEICHMTEQTRVYKKSMWSLLEVFMLLDARKHD